MAEEAAERVEGEVLEVVGGAGVVGLEVEAERVGVVEEGVEAREVGVRAEVLEAGVKEGREGRAAQAVVVEREGVEAA